MNDAAFGADIERILDKWTEMVQNLGHVVDSNSCLAGARAELANARKLLEAAEAITEVSINKVASIKLCDDLMAAIAACRASTGKNQNA